VTQTQLAIDEPLTMQVSAERDEGNRNQHPVDPIVPLDLQDRRHLLICSLFEDVGNLLPIAHLPQELWLGVHLRAPSRIADADGRDSDCHTTLSSVYSKLLRADAELCRLCASIDIEPPRTNLWARECLSARGDIHKLHRSALLRFMRMVEASATADRKDSALELTHMVAELLALLPDRLLDRVIRSSYGPSGLPTLSERELAAEKSPGFTVDEAAMSRAQHARNTLVTGYLRYVLKIARNHVGNGIEYEDLVQEGALGLMRAADRFDYRQIKRFATYATSWIWQALGRAVADHSRTIRLPVHMHEQVNQMTEVLAEETGATLTHAMLMRIARRTGHASRSTSDVTESAKHNGQTRSAPGGKSHRKRLRGIAAVLKCAMPPLRLDDKLPASVRRELRARSPDENDEDWMLHDFVPDVHTEQPDQVPDTMAYAYAIEKAVAATGTQASRDRAIVEMRYGLQDGVEHTLEEVGQKFGLTRERIRQIENRALKRMQTELRGSKAALTVAGGRVHHPQYPEPVRDMIDGQLGCLFESDFTHDSVRALIDSLLEKLPGGDRRQKMGGSTRLEQLRAALMGLGTPSHYADIADQLNAESDDELDAAYVYGLLQRYDDTFMLLGEGVFSLVAWERHRKTEICPVLPWCPTTVTTPPGSPDVFFDSVVVASGILRQPVAAVRFLDQVLLWAESSALRSPWLLQSIMSSYYAVGLIPYVFLQDEPERLISINPEAPLGLQELRLYCLDSLTGRVAAMREFWWLFLRHQPTSAAGLGSRLSDVHPLGLDDTSNRISILVSIGAARKTSYGRYQLTPLGEAIARDAAQLPAAGSQGGVDEQPDEVDQEYDLIDLGIWDQT